MTGSRLSPIRHCCGEYTVGHNLLRSTKRDWKPDQDYVTSSANKGLFANMGTFMKPFESEQQRDTEVVATTREQWQRPTFKKTDAKDAESGANPGADAGTLS